MPQQIVRIPYRVFNPAYTTARTAAVANGSALTVLIGGVATLYYVYRIYVMGSNAGNYVLEYSNGSNLFDFNLVANVPFMIDFTDLGMSFDTTTLGLQILNNSGGASDMVHNSLYDTQPIP